MGEREGEIVTEREGGRGKRETMKESKRVTAKTERE
jgi:hypothetical protein